MKLSNNTILITGGGSGIGLAFAEALLARSNTIIICGRNAEKLQAVKNELPSVVIFPCDITKDGERNNLFAFIQTQYPHLNILINNAGIQKNYDFTDLTRHSDLIDTEINTNFTAPVKLVDGFLPILLKQPQALIINITSALAVVSKQSAPVYCGTKAALHAFSEALRYQLEGSAVGVIEIIPALVDTEMTKGRGKSKISPEALVKQAIIGIEKGQREIKIGKAKALFLLHRFLPFFAKKIVRHG